MSNCINNKIPSERIRVFISSAQSEENGFAWSDVRKKIKKKLSNCIYFYPFILEDEASTTSSLQFFQRQVERSDVVVLLVKNEVRNGTLTEFSLAKKLKKPMLVYFLEEESPKPEVVNLKNDIISNDICTYRIISNTDTVDNEVFCDLLNNVVRAFQDRYYYTDVDKSEFTDAMFSSEIPAGNLSMTSNSTLKKFSSCYNYLFDLLNFGCYKEKSAKSDYHSFGCSLINWLINGKWDITDSAIATFITALENTYLNADCLKLRWKAIKHYIEGDLSNALYEMEKALDIAKQANEPVWIINNILIDCRNIEMDIAHKNGQRLAIGKYQTEISNQDYLVCFPVLDRYLTNILDQINNDQFRIDTATPYTKILGTGFPQALKDVANYLFVSAIYGSVTHINKCREVLANVLISYSKIMNYPDLSFEGLKQYLLCGQGKKFNEYIDSEWDTLYSFVASKADYLWHLLSFVPKTSCDSMKMTLISKVGLYFTDDVFSEAEKYIYNSISDIEWYNSDLLLEAVLNNLKRMNPNRVIDLITKLIDEQKYSLGFKISHIILYVNLDLVSDKRLKVLASVLKKHLPSIIDKNGDPQMIAALVDRSPEMFSELETIEGNGLVGFEKSLYKINKGEQNWIDALDDGIELAKHQFENNKKDGVYTQFAFDPYKMISRIIRNEFSSIKLRRLLMDGFVPHIIDVLNSNAAVEVKESCLACVCEYLSLLNKSKEKKPKTLVDALVAFDINKGTEFLNSSTRKCLEIRALISRIMCGILDINSLLQWSVDYEHLEAKERIVLADCIEKYLYYNRKNVNTLLVSLVLQCSSDKESIVRQTAYKCLAYIASFNQDDIILNALNNGVYDPSDRVRITMLNLCKQNDLPNALSNTIVSILQNDSNSTIREAAKKANIQ